MKYFSLFTGIGGFELGIQQATNGGWECVGYSEIDKYAIQTFEKNFPNIKNYGDTTKIKPEELPDFDLICGGFPCQAFSIAGKRRGFEDTRGTLFFDIARIIKVKRPKIVFLENVKGLLNHNKGETFRVIIQTLSELGYDVQWMVLNSKFFGVPQNRERVFIIGSVRGEPRPEILPFRESNSSIGEGRDEKCFGTITAQQYKVGWNTPCIAIGGLQTNASIMKDCSPTLTKAMGDGGGHIPCIKQKRIRNFGASGHLLELNGICNTLTQSMGTGGNNVPFICAERKAERNKPKAEREYDGQQLEPRFDGVSNTLTSVQKDNYVFIQSHSPRSGDPNKGGTGPLKSDKHCFTLDRSPHYVNNIRKLTPLECERLQGYPDNWTEGVSDTQRYKQCGNAVTVNVIREITKKLNSKQSNNIKEEEWN